MPAFAVPRPLEFDEETMAEIAHSTVIEYEEAVRARTEWNNKHQLYEDMFRGRLPAREGPWEGSADLHVQAPYWLVDSINVRLMLSTWNQVPQVTANVEEEDDIEVADRAAKLVEWHLGPNRMNARERWGRASKVRLIHGASVSLITYVLDTYRYRLAVEAVDMPQFGPDGELVLDVDGYPDFRRGEEENMQEGVYYQGPVIQPLEFDDFVLPIGAMNAQPKRPSNPGGAEWCTTRQYEVMTLMFQKALKGFGGAPAYSDMPNTDGDEGREWWKAHAPGQDRISNTENDRRVRQQDDREGMNRSQQQKRDNPEYEVLTRFGTYPDPITGEDEEMVFFVCRHPEIYLGGFYLSDYYWKGERPLLELHYQKVGTRFYSMGVMEIVQHLSAEIDTIHNMRIDVGFATNMPYFFYRAASGFDPDEIELRPLKGVPVDDPKDFVFPQMQNVTSFYNQEETLLYTLIERVMGVTDLFLGVSPTRGASARHATGFVGTQQEAEARKSEISNQDAEAFGFLAKMIYNMELQFGPPERTFRLQGEGQDEPVGLTLSREDLWFRGEYDFTLGANYGSYSQMQKQQQSQAVLDLAGSSPLINQDPVRRWEAEAFYLRSIGIRRPEVFIGPKEALPVGSPTKPPEEAAQMDQFKFGIGKAAPIHPSDNDDEHIEFEMEYLRGNIFRALGEPNREGHMAHIQAHQDAKMSKMQQAQMAQMQAMMGGQQNGGGQAPGGPAPPAPGQAPVPPQMGMQPQGSPVGPANGQINNVPPFNGGGGMQ